VANGMDCVNGQKCGFPTAQVGVADKIRLLLSALTTPPLTGSAAPTQGLSLFYKTDNGSQPAIKVHEIPDKMGRRPWTLAPGELFFEDFEIFPVNDRIGPRGAAASTIHAMA